MTSDNQPLFGDGKDEFAFKLLRKTDLGREADNATYTDGQRLYHAFNEWRNFGIACREHRAKVFDGMLCFVILLAIAEKTSRSHGRIHAYILHWKNAS